MLTPSPRLRISLAAALLLAALSTGALASPDYAPIPPTAAAASAAVAIDKFLVDKGLIPAASVATTSGPAFADRVRAKASDMVITAMNFLGVPYRRGGNDAESGFDCSGFTRQVFETSLGLVLPRRAEQQAKAPGLLAVKRDELQPGDLVFFNTLKRTFSHVGIYVGDGKFIHAPKPGGEVRVESMNFAYWAKRFTGGRRAESAQEQSAAADAASLLNARITALVPGNSVPGTAE
ncbi:MAG TPA: C40 family peptidase [Burkholderiaceae bacterium]|jgi:cell wall-associated NlpC family hydrolase